MSYADIVSLSTLQPKHSAKLYGHHNDQIFAWVRECCLGDYRCNRNTWTGNNPAVQIEDDAEYELFVLRWFNYIMW